MSQRYIDEKWARMQAAEAARVALTEDRSNNPEFIRDQLNGGQYESWAINRLL